MFKRILCALVSPAINRDAVGGLEIHVSGVLNAANQLQTPLSEAPEPLFYSPTARPEGGAKCIKVDRTWGEGGN